MKLTKLKIRKQDSSIKMKSEDLRYLQMAISGRSVYRNQVASYLRKPKYRNVEY